MPYRTAHWRLLITPPAPGAWNMAVDEAILEGIVAAKNLPALRLYAWQPACLSLGYAQPFEDADAQRLKARGWDIVRRPTGGRAILHTDELTYSVIGPPQDVRLSGSVLESYKRISQALLAALHRLDIPATANSLPSQPAGSDPQNPVCFEVPSNYEITVGGKKLVGSAQARRREGILQHGSLPLYGDLTRITQVLKYNSKAKRSQAASRVTARACTVAEILGNSIRWEDAAGAFAQAFQEVLSLQLTPAELTPGELARAEILVQEKYANSSWTQRV